jgi:hypothetical protein
MITPTIGGATSGIGKSKSGQSYKFPILGYDKSGLKLRNDKQITEDVRKFGVALATEEAMTLTGGKPAPGKVTKLGNAGAIRGLAGTIFEAAVSALIKGPQYDMGQTSTFDFVGSNARNSLAKLYPGLNSSAQFIEAKIGFNSKIGTSMANKIEAYRGGPNTITRKAAQQLMGMRVGGRDAKAIQKEFGKISTRGAGGYIPNFADGLMGAITREKNAGLPISQIRINQSGKLRNAQNPMGLAVTNTRDEPTGRIPNYAKPGGDIDSAIDGSIMKFFALQMAISSFTTVLGSAEEDANIFQKGLYALGDATMAAVNAMMVMQMVGVNPFGKSEGAAAAMGGFGRRMLGQPKIGPMGPGATRVVSLLTKLGRFAGPIGLGLTAIMGISSAAKMITGKGILEHLGFAAKGAADRLDEIPGAGNGAPKTKVESLNEKQNKLLVRRLELEQKLLNAKEREAAFMEKSGGRSSAEVLAEYGNLTAPRLEKPDDQMTSEEKKAKAFRDKSRNFQAGQLNLLMNDPNFGAGKDVANLTNQLKNLQNSIEKNTTELANLEISSFEAQRRFARESGDSLNNLKISQARARNQVLLDADPGASSSERLDNEFFLKRLDIQNEFAVQMREQRIEMVNQFQIEKNLTDVQSNRLDKIIEMVNNGAKLKDIKDSELAAELSSKINLEEIYQKAELISDAAKRELFLKEQMVEVERELKKEQLARDSGIQGYINNNKKELQRMQENFGRNMAESFENAMNDAFSRVGQDGYDTVGKVFGQIALQFGKDLMAAQRQASIKNISTKMVETVTNFFKPKGYASGGLVTGGSGVRDDVPARLNNGEYVIRKSAVAKYGVGFFKRLNEGNINGYNSGGSYSTDYLKGLKDQHGVLQGVDNLRQGRFFAGAEKFGGSGLAQSHMFGGELSNQRLAKAREMEFFMPGTRGMGSIVGKENLLAFSQQQYTSGSTDIISSGPSGGFINLEDQSVRLSAFARRRMSPARQRLEEAQRLAYDTAMRGAAEEQRVFDEHINAKKQRSEQFKADVKQAFVDATINAISAGINSMGNTGSLGQTDIGSQGIPGDPAFQRNQGMKYLDSTSNPNMMDFNRATSGGFQMYSAGGGASQGNANAVLTAGEFVVSAPAAASVGKGALDSINQMRYNSGGPVGKVGSGGADVGSINITVNVNEDGSSQSNTTGGSKDEKSKNTANKIREAVLNVINEEKRVSGSLFTRNK